MLMNIIEVLLTVLFTVLGVVFIFVSATDLRERWARHLFGTGIILLLLVAIFYKVF